MILHLWLKKVSESVLMTDKRKKLEKNNSLRYKEINK